MTFIAGFFFLIFLVGFVCNIKEACDEEFEDRMRK